MNTEGRKQNTRQMSARDLGLNGTSRCAQLVLSLGEVEQCQPVQMREWPEFRALTSPFRLGITEACRGFLSNCSTELTDKTCGEVCVFVCCGPIQDSNNVVTSGKEPVSEFFSVKLSQNILVSLVNPYYYYTKDTSIYTSI